MGYAGQNTHPEVQALMEKGVKRIRDAGIVAGVSCPDALIPKFLGLGVQYFHSSVGRLLHGGGSVPQDRAKSRRLIGHLSHAPRLPPEPRPP